jgi:hypothetical protein
MDEDLFNAKKRVGRERAAHIRRVPTNAMGCADFDTHYDHKKCRFSDSTQMFSIFCAKE